MKRISFLYFTLLFSLVFTACDQKRISDRGNIPVESFFRNPDESNFQLSPDGKKLLFLKRTENRLNLFVRDLKTNLETQLTFKKNNDIEIFYWVTTDRIIYVDDIEGKQSCQLYTVKIDGSGRINLAPFADIRVYIIDGRVFGKADILVSFNQRGANLFDVYRINTETGEIKTIAENNGRITKWFPDNQGIIRLAMESDGVNSRLLYRKNENESFHPIRTLNFMDRLIPLSFLDDDQRVFALSNMNRDKLALVELNPENPENEKLIFEDANVDVSEYTLAQHTQQLTEISYRTKEIESFYVQSCYDSIYQGLKQKFPNRNIKITSSDKGENRFVIRISSSRFPGSYFLFDRKSHDLRLLSETNSEIDPEQMAESKLMYIPTSDGPLNTLLTMPVRAGNEPIPFVVYLGQNPTNTVGFFDPVTQYLANRGFGVLQVFYRGINGFGKAYKMAGHKEHSGRSIEDITTATEWLIQNGYSTSKSIAVFGAFYGGYASMNALIQRPDLFACAVSYSGFYNLLSYVDGIPEFFKPYQMMLFEVIGNPKNDSLMMRSRSPFFQFKKIKKPVFLYQGKNDPRVNYRETNEFVRKIRREGIEAEYLLAPNEGRGMKKEENKLKFFRKLEVFLTKHLKH